MSFDLYGEKRGWKMDAKSEASDEIFLCLGMKGLGDEVQ